MLLEAGHTERLAEMATTSEVEGSNVDTRAAAERSLGPAADASALRSFVEQTIGRTTGFSDVFLVDLVVRGHKGSRVVEVYVDGDEALTIDRVATLSRLLQSVVETSGLVEGDFRLDVSTPGADSPLRQPRQFAKHAGRTVNVRLERDGVSSTLKGVLRSATAHGIEVETDGSLESVPFNQLIECRVALPW